MPQAGRQASRSAYMHSVKIHRKNSFRFGRQRAAARRDIRMQKPKLEIIVPELKRTYSGSYHCKYISAYDVVGPVTRSRTVMNPYIILMGPLTF